MRVYFKIIGLILRHLNSVFGPEVIGGIDTIRHKYAIRYSNCTMKYLLIHLIFN